MKILCACDTGKAYANCCKIFHEGAYPDNALSLMRSRYSAYAYQLAEYIIRTTHPDHSHYNHNHHEWILEILDFSKNTKFKKLEILDFIDGMNKAYVTFNAHLMQQGILKELVEKSYFEKVGKQWLYKSGIHLKLR